MPLSSWNSSDFAQDTAGLQRLCNFLLPAAFAPFRDAAIEASFYPYVGLTHTIRRKKSKWVIRISDHCRNAPDPVLEAVVMILGCKVMRRKPRQEWVRAYDDFRKEPRVADVVRQRRLRKGRKILRTQAGRYYSPRDIYTEINGRHFNNQVEIGAIGWGPRESWRRLGHYDPVHHTITLSPVLDSPRVPQYVVQYIVFHEMLHTLFQETSSGRPWKHHPPEFRRAERAYPDYSKARIFLKGFCRKRGSGKNRTGTTGAGRENVI